MTESGTEPVPPADILEAIDAIDAIDRVEDAAARITPYPDGPLIVRGDFALCELDGTPIPRSGRAVALCRCGRSAVKPFCDGSHRLAGRS
ncbi:CDGSH iron-sulfur domain-containing protein [Jatrophihabitans sp.]|uniref:CDGSH iron-sulfur domain-containing protein n=1 Tax=Jatrophihabitans sp. TaxID=1932789 RepID=UPI002C85318E|nr:CDGSH iron-sulfur domain-containing protein [Jatrophihabitans sp.]